MSNILLKQAPQSFVLQPQQSHPRLSLTRVLYVKFLRWVEKASPGTLLRTLAGLGLLALIALIVMAPAFTVGMLVDVLHWNGYRIPILVLTVALCLKTKPIFRWALRFRFNRLGANQHAYQGLPVDELASYLIEQQSFKRDEAMSHFGITQPKHVTISKELEHHQVLVRGESNARVLNGKLTREQLVRQLRENFPLEFHQDEWCERNGSWERHLRSEERKKQQARQEVEGLEKRAGKASAILQEVRELKRAEGFAYRTLVAA